MRKVHKAVIDAIHAKKHMRKGNYEVAIHYGADHNVKCANVHLFGNHIATWAYEGDNCPSTWMRITPVRCSATTKSILHELLVELGHTQVAGRMRLYQRDWQWYLELPNAEREDSGALRVLLYSDSVVDVFFDSRWGRWCVMPADRNAYAIHPMVCHPKKEVC